MTTVKTCENNGRAAGAKATYREKVPRELRPDPSTLQEQNMHPLTDQLPDHMDALAMRQACGEIEAGLRKEVERLREALSQLTNEASGICGIAENQIRFIVGNTNFDCLVFRVSAARAALEATK